MQKTPPRWFDIPSLLLLVVATLIASARLVVTDWIPDLDLIASITRMGLFIGLVIGYSRFKKTLVSLLTLGYSLTLVPWLIYLKITPYLTVEERLYEMGSRIHAAFTTFLAREAVEDPIMVVILLGLLFWIAAIYGIFVLQRHKNGLAALLPSALLILAIQYNDHKVETPLWILGFYFFFAFLLLARLDYLNNRERWQKRNFFILPDAKIDLGIFNTVALAVFLLFAWSLPSSNAEWKELARWWDKTTYKFENTRRNLDNLFSSVDNPVQVRGAVLYGSSLTLGERSYQGTNTIAMVDVPEDFENAPPRYYWRVRSYDTYENGSWSESEEQVTELLAAQSPLLIPIDPESETAIFTFTNKAEQTVNLLTPHQTYWVDMNTYATYTELPEGTLDLNLLRSPQRLLFDEQYSVRAAPLAPTVAELRAAGREYPEWVTSRYLQLPDDLPNDIPELAREIVRGRASAYDQARVITLYLRAEIEYSDTIPPPPAGQDPLEWFLFTWREGYCNYSASAAVVMLRSLGIPSRLVVGFAQGQKVENGDYVVIQKNAHAWPEVYFPNIGWVEFEPTGNQTRLIRPLGELEAVDEELDILRSGLVDDEELLDEEPVPTSTPDIPEPLELPDEAESGNASRLTVLFWGIIILIAVVLFFGLWQLNRKQPFFTRGLRQAIQLYERQGWSTPKWLLRWLARLEAKPMERAFDAINRALRWLSDDIPPHLTPLERAELLVTLLPEEQENVMLLQREHEKALFTPADGDIENAQHAGNAIVWAALKQKLQRRPKNTRS